MLFLRPTKRGWVVMLTGIAWFLIAVVNHMVFPFLFACGAGALVLASLLCAALSLRGINVRRGAAGEAATGQPVAMPLIVENRFRRKRQAVVVVERFAFCPEEVTSTIVDTLAPHEKRVVNRRILAMRRGEFEADTLLLRGGDPAGLFVRERRLSLPKRILIAPGVEPLPDLVLKHRHTLVSTAGSPVSAAGASQEFYGVRKYNPSDGFRCIHWKTSARFGRLMVREFERNAVMSVAVLLDANEHFVSGPEHWSNLEYQVRAAASVCRHLAGLYCNFALGAGGSKKIILPPKLASESEIENLYQLAILQPGRVPLAEVVYDLAESLPNDTMVFCLSLATPRPLAEALHVLRLQGMSVRWYCARRDAFRENNGKADTPAADVDGQTTMLVQAAELHPGMPLARVFALTP